MPKFTGPGAQRQPFLTPGALVFGVNLTGPDILAVNFTRGKLAVAFTMRVSLCLLRTSDVRGQGRSVALLQSHVSLGRS